MRNRLFLTTAALALALSARPAPAQTAQTQTGDQPLQRPGAAQTPERGAPRRAGAGEPQRPAAGAAQSQPGAAGSAGQRPAEGDGAAAGAQRSGEAAPSQEPRRPNAGKAGEPGRPAAETDRTKVQGAGGGARPPETGAARAGETPRTQAGKPEAGKADAGRADAAQGGDRPRIEGRLGVNERDAAGLRDRLIGTRHDAVTNVRIDARVGARISTEVTIREVPAEIVAQYPMFRGYDYVVSEEQVVIVDPKTREVVEVIGGGGPRSATAAPRSGPRQRFTTEQRQIVRKHLPVEPSSRVVFDERTVHEVPTTVVLRPLPEAVVEGVPDIRGYEYFVDSDDHVVLVDPATREVVDILD